MRNEEIGWYTFLAVAGFIILTRWRAVNTLIATEGAGVETFTNILQGGTGNTGY